MQSFNKLLDLDLAIVQDAYHAEYLTREKVAEHERSEVKFRMLVEAAACMVVILRADDTIAYFSPYSEELTGYLETEVIGAALSAAVRSRKREGRRFRSDCYNACRRSNQGIRNAHTTPRWQPAMDRVECSAIRRF